MRIGYDRLLTSKETIEGLTGSFLPGEVDQVVIDSEITKEVYPDSSRLTRLLSNCEVGDTVVIHRLERVSSSPTVWRHLLLELMNREIQLEVLVSPSLTLENWLEVLKWWQPVTDSSHSKSRIISVGKETKNDSQRILPFRTNAADRELYWQLFKEIQQGASLRRTAKRLNVSQGTVLRVKRDLIKLKQTVWLVLTFIITVASLKIAEAYADHWLLQILIGGLATLAIIYFSYSDMKELD